MDNFMSHLQHAFVHLVAKTVSVVFHGVRVPEAVGSVLGEAWLILAGSRRRFNLYFDRGLVKKTSRETAP
jgi:hypothetical protein